MNWHLILEWTKTAINLGFAVAMYFVWRSMQKAAKQSEADLEKARKALKTIQEIKRSP